MLTNKVETGLRPDKPSRIILYQEKENANLGWRFPYNKYSNFYKT